MPSRFIFRMTQYQDLRQFFADGELRSKNHLLAQSCHQASYIEIVNRRNTSVIITPDGKVINEHVAFYFSPITAMAYTIHKKNVTLIDPQGNVLGPATMDDRVFFVANIEKIAKSNLDFWFSNVACNSLAPLPAFEKDIAKLEQHIDWSVFDENPIVGNIPEIGYSGVTKYQHNRDEPARYANRRQKRMAEFLIRDKVPINLFDCIITKNDSIKNAVECMMKGTGLEIPVFANAGCYFE